MAAKELHPSITQFKEFVKQNPKLIQEVRAGKATWQELYEDWYLLGEEDSRWNEYSEGVTPGRKETQQEKTGDWISKIVNAVKHMDADQVQGQIHNISQAIGAIQGVLSQFQGGQGSIQKSKREAPHHPFIFRKD